VEQAAEETRNLRWSGRFLTSEDTAAGEDEVVLVPVKTIWSEKQLPFALLKPFGYSAGRTQLQIGCFWGWLTLGCVLHVWKYMSSKKLLEAQQLAAEEKAHPSMVKSFQNQETVDVETASGPSNPDDEEVEA
jgi:high-affinity iron transporter